MVRVASKLTTKGRNLLRLDSRFDCTPCQGYNVCHATWRPQETRKMFIPQPLRPSLHRLSSLRLQRTVDPSPDFRMSLPSKLTRRYDYKFQYRALNLRTLLQQTLSNSLARNPNPHLHRMPAFTIPVLGPSKLHSTKNIHKKVSYKPTPLHTAPVNLNSSPKS